MLQIFHAPRTRSHRLVWLCEEMAVPYALTVETFGAPSAEFLAVSPFGTFPAIRDGDRTMLESIAIMLYIMGTHGPTDLAVPPGDADYGAYLEFLIFGEAGTAMWANPIMATKFYGPDDQKSNWTTKFCAATFFKRLGYAATKLGDGPYLLGDRFTAADISVGYTVGIARWLGADLPSALLAYHDRVQARPAHQRAAARS
jgi:glutathione S-transferase